MSQWRSQVNTVITFVTIWGIAALLLALIYRLYRNKKISGKRASVFATYVFIARGILMMLLAGSFLHDVYKEYTEESRESSLESFETILAKEEEHLREEARRIDRMLNEEKKKFEKEYELLLQH